jgi:DNA-binding NarL/FixJ family response regulator
MRLALCSKEGLFGEALACLLDHHGSYQVVASEDSAIALVKAAKDQHAHILIVDSQGLDANDLQFLLGARAFGDFAVVLIAEDSAREKYADVPVDRIVPRNSTSSKLFEALSELGGSLHITIRPYVREGRRGYGRSANELSKREYECAQLVAKGMSNRKIAHVTGLREQSVKNLVSVVMRKLNCENRVQVALRLTQGTVPAVEAETE